VLTPDLDITTVVELLVYTSVSIPAPPSMFWEVGVFVMMSEAAVPIKLLDGVELLAEAE